MLKYRYPPSARVPIAATDKPTVLIISSKYEKTQHVCQGVLPISTIGPIYLLVVFDIYNKNMTSHIHKAGGILLKNKKLLVEKSITKEFFIAPGGSIEHNETPKQALIRELFEEFQIKVLEKDLEEYGTFTAPAAGQEGKTVTMELFIVKSWEGEPTPDHEVEQLLWIDTSWIGRIKIGSIFEHDVIPSLKASGLID